MLTPEGRARARAIPCYANRRMEVLVILYKFASTIGSRFALTPDARGENLPKGSVIWERIGKLEIEDDNPPRIGAEARRILDVIGRAGIYLWPEQQ